MLCVTPLNMYQSKLQNNERPIMYLGHERHLFLCQKHNVNVRFVLFRKSSTTDKHWFRMF